MDRSRIWRTQLKVYCVATRRATGSSVFNAALRDATSPTQGTSTLVMRRLDRNDQQRSRSSRQSVEVLSERRSSPSCRRYLTNTPEMPDEQRRLGATAARRRLDEVLEAASRRLADGERLLDLLLRRIASPTGTAELAAAKDRATAASERRALMSLVSDDGQYHLRQQAFLRDAILPILPFLEDPAVTDIMLNADGCVWVDQVGRSRKTSVTMDAPKALAILRAVAGQADLQLTSASPSLDAELRPWGARVKAAIPPITKAPVFTIRKPPARVFTLDEYVGAGIITGRERRGPARSWRCTGCAGRSRTSS